MLVLDGGSSVARRIQGAWVTEDEVRKVASVWKRQAPEVRFDDSVQGSDDGPGGSTSGVGGGGGGDDEDDMLWQAMELVVRSQLGSTSMLQRKLRVGFARAGRLMDLLEQRGVVGPVRGVEGQGGADDRRGARGAARAATTADRRAGAHARRGGPTRPAVLLADDPRSSPGRRRHRRAAGSVRPMARLSALYDRVRDPHPALIDVMVVRVPGGDRCDHRVRRRGSPGSSRATRSAWPLSASPCRCRCCGGAADRRRSWPSRLVGMVVHSVAALPRGRRPSSAC